MLFPAGCQPAGVHLPWGCWGDLSLRWRWWWLLLCSRTWWLHTWETAASGVRVLLSAQVWQDPVKKCCWLRTGLEPPGTAMLTHSCPFRRDCDTCISAQLCSWVPKWYCITHPSTGRKFDYSTLASNVITLNRRRTFSLLNFLLCSASLSGGKQVYKSAASLFQLLHVHPPHSHALVRGVRHSLAARAVLGWPNFLQSAAKAVDINFKGKQLPFIITHGFSSTSFK